MITVNYKEMGLINEPSISLIISGKLINNVLLSKENTINVYDLLNDCKIIVECDFCSDKKTFVYFSIILDNNIFIGRDFYNKIYPELLLMGYPVSKLYSLSDIRFKKSKKNGYNVFKDMVTYIINSYIFENTNIEFTDCIEVEIYNNVF